MPQPEQELSPAPEKLPGVQSEATSEPSVQKLPAGQSVHASDDVSPGWSPKRPDGHATAADTASGQYAPRSHCAGLMVPLPQ